MLVFVNKYFCCCPVSGAENWRDAINNKSLQLEAAHYESLYFLLQILTITLFEKTPLQAFPVRKHIHPEVTSRNRLIVFYR